MFSSNWFDRLAKPNFEGIIKPLFSGKNIKYLEIGTFEGASLHYMFTNILTNNESTSTVIDPFTFSNNQYEIFSSNMEKFRDRIDLYKGMSEDFLPILPKNYYDFIYIDGDHTSDGVFKDAILSFPLLKQNGIIIFDDYLWRYNGDHTIPNLDDKNLSHPNNPYTGINKFLELYKNQLLILEQNWQMIIQKI
jgi:predicted O-methyltransferase YrrM